VNGNGADEIFSGYYDHYLFWLAGLSAEPDLYDQEVALWRTSLGRHVQNPYLKDPARFVRDPNGRDHLHLNAPDVAGFLKFSPANSFSEQGYCKDLLRCRMLNELHRESVPVLTWAHDSHYMAHSIENRAAYLDRQLVDFMSKVPSLYLIQQGLTKALLRYTGRGIVPEEILGLKKKLGFNAPILSLLDRKDRKVQDRILAESSFWELVDKEKVMPLLQQGADIAGRNNFLFCLIAARLFYEQFVD
jgi:asparagine synthase (glutamine-hydrolysing)